MSNFQIEIGLGELRDISRRCVSPRDIPQEFLSCCFCRESTGFPAEFGEVEEIGASFISVMYLKRDRSTHGCCLGCHRGFLQPSDDFNVSYEETYGGRSSNVSLTAHYRIY